MSKFQKFHNMPIQVPFVKMSNNKHQFGVKKTNPNKNNKSYNIYEKYDDKPVKNDLEK